MPLLGGLPVLSIMTSRSDRAAPGRRLSASVRDLFGDALTEIRLEPLTSEDTRTLVANLLEIESLPSDTRDLTLAKADGNPSLVEEDIRMLYHRGARRRQAARRR